MRLALTLFSLIGVLSYSYSQVPNYVPTSGLVAWYGFNGSAVDESGNGNTAINGGATLTDDRFASSNSAYFFNGSSRMDLIEDYDSTERSVSLWFSASNFSPTGQNVFDNDYPSLTNGHSLITLSSGGQINTAFGLAGCLSTFASINTWYSVIMTRDIDSSRFYVDGVLVCSDINGNVNSVSANSNFMILGCSRWWDRYFTGKIDDVGVWDRRLTECEVAQLYQAQQLGSPASFFASPLYGCAPLTSNFTNSSSGGVDCYWEFGDGNTSTGCGTVSNTYADTGLFDLSLTIIDSLGCSNAITYLSYIYVYDCASVDELAIKEKEVVKIVDLLGRETPYKPNTPLIYIYLDGTTEKVFKLEE